MTVGYREHASDSSLARLRRASHVARTLGCALLLACSGEGVPMTIVLNGPAGRLGTDDPRL